MTAVNADPDTFGKLSLAHFVLHTGDHCLFLLRQKTEKDKKVKFEIDVHVS